MVQRRAGWTDGWTNGRDQQAGPTGGTRTQASTEFLPLFPASYPGSVAQPDFRQGYLVLAIAIVTEVTGSVSLRGALDYPWLYAVVAVAFTGAFGLLSFVLRTGIGIGVAYGIWGASGVALTAVASMVIFNEPVTPVMWAGIGLIIAGVICIELGSGAAKRKASAALSYGHLAAEYGTPPGEYGKPPGEYGKHPEERGPNDPEAGERT